MPTVRAALPAALVTAGLFAALAWTYEASLWPQLIGWIIDEQRRFHAALAAGLRALSTEGSATAAWGLVAASILYGIFHGAGPGHGKVVVAAYLFAHESRLARGLGLSVAAALCQGLVAVAVVYGLIFVAGWLPRETQSAVAWTERLSFALLTAMGAILAGRGLRDIIRERGKPKFAPIGTADACCHGIVASTAQLDRATDARAALGIVLSIGLRPCTGAVLVLALAKALGLAWAGVAAVFAMSVGTAATVAALAVLTVKARRWTLAAFRRDPTRLRLLGHVFALVSGGAIAAMAVSLLAGSFAPAHPLGL